MKKILLPLLLFVSILSACSDDKDPVVNNPVQVGDEIQFGAALPDHSNNSRTIYGDDILNEGNKRYFPIYWVDKDEIAIFSPEVSHPAEKWSPYQIRVSNPTSSHAESIVRLGDSGLQWGQAAEHHFHAIYPASLVQQGSNWQNGLDVVLPEIQQATVAYNVKEKVHVARPDMNNALMYAYSTYDRNTAEAGKPIHLEFEPLASVIDITVNGPSVGNVSKEVVINSIQVIAKKNIATAELPKIAGKFSVKFGKKGKPVNCSAPHNNKPNDNTNSVTISLGTKGVTLGQGEKLQAKAFLIPDAAQLKDCDFSIRVSVSKGGFTKTKTFRNMEIDPGKVTRVNLPNLDKDLDVNYWMSELDPSVYLTEISVPGSKMSVLTKKNEANIVYQESDIETQFKAGVRGFILQTIVERRSVNGSYQNKLYVTCDGKNVMTLKKAIEEISTYLKGVPDNKHEYAFVMITYSDRGYTDETIRTGRWPNYEYVPRWGDNLSQDQCWMKTLAAEANEMAANPTVYRVYSGEVNPNTTLGDVANQIVLKANYNYNGMFSKLTTADKAPILYSVWLEPYKTQPLFWGLPSTDSNDAKLTWTYQEVTTVERAEIRTNAEAILTEKIGYMKEIFTKSLNEYATNDEHKVWYMNDLGGILVNGTTDNKTLELAKIMNEEAIKTLSLRDKNATLGLVFMNFADREATAQECRSDFLIQTIIDNNFKFNLRTREEGSRAISTKAVNDDPNAWDN